MKKLPILLTLLIPFFSFSQIIQVPLDYPTIQQGIDAAMAGDTVLVDTGTYFENINIHSNIVVTSHFILGSDSLKIYNTIVDGSLPTIPEQGSVVSFGSGTDTTAILCGFTIVNGTGTLIPFSFPVRSGGGIYFNNAGGKIEHNIIKQNKCILDTLDGSTYGGGIANGPPGTNHFIIIENNKIYNNISWSKGSSSNELSGWAVGGGVSMAINGEILNNEIFNNICQSDSSFSIGGGIRLNAFGSEALIKVFGNIIRDNQSISVYSNSFAAGVSCSGAHSIIENNLIMNNFLTGINCRGAGLYFDLDHSYISVVKNNQIIGNGFISENCIGGGIGIYRSDTIYLVNNLFFENSALSGGALSVKDSKPLAISNNTMIYNDADQNGGAIYIYDNSDAVILNSIIRLNSAMGEPNEIDFDASSSLSVAFSNIEGGWEGEGNINLDPKFTGLGNHPYQINDYSPCIDQGKFNTIGLNLPEYDLAGEVRIFNDRIDMGAYEWNIYVGEEEFISENVKLKVKNYPNPFSISTTISYTLDQPTNVQVTIVNQMGKQVDMLWQIQLKGEQRIIWDASDQPSGVYYFRLKVGEQLGTGKILLIR